MTEPTIVYRLRIRELRRAIGMRAEEASFRLGVTYNTLASWERHASVPRATDVPALAQLFGCELHELFEEVEVR